MLIILLMGMIGTLVELLLLDHYEDAKQLIPVGLSGLALGLLAWHGLRPRASVMRAFRITMALFIVSGFVGVVLHYRSNREFQLEVDPSAGGFSLFSKVMRAKAPPALAPGVMVELGLLGLVYAFKHPVLTGALEETTEDGG